MLNTNEIFGGTYQIIKEIGRGGAGVVYLALHLRLQKYVVVKQIRTKYQDSPQWRVETDILKNLHHPSLPQIYDFIVREGEVYTVMDYVEGRDFSQLGCGPGIINPQMAMKWFRQLMEVLVYMHTRQHPIIHSDIKPANIMLRPDGDICLIDFNISLEGNQQSMIIGYSDVFASPEQEGMALAYQHGQAVNYSLDERTDIYSAAATFYYLISGILPNTRGEYPKLSEINGLPYPPGFLNILDKCLSVDRNHRYSSAVKVIKAFDNLKKQDARYRRYLFFQSLSWVGCALIVSLGIYLTVIGSNRAVDNAYRSRYAKFYESASGGDAFLTETIGYEILNEPKYKSVLDKNPSDKAMIFHTIGDAYYSKGDYQGAAEAYENAVKYAPGNDINIGNYYLDYAMALAECGEYMQARDKISLAGNSVSQSSIYLLDAKIALLSGDLNGCTEKVNAILSLPGSADECAQACMIQAQCIGERTVNGIAWMERALQYKQDSEGLRALATNCLAVAGMCENTSDKRTFIEKAKQYYARLVSEADATEEDWLGYAVTLYVAGDRNNCSTILQRYASAGSTDYRVYLYLALCASETQNKEAAKGYCSTALKLVRQMSETEKNRADSGMIQRLNSLASELGVQ